MTPFALLVSLRDVKLNELFTKSNCYRLTEGFLLHLQYSRGTQAPNLTTFASTIARQHVNLLYEFNVPMLLVDYERRRSGGLQIIWLNIRLGRPHRTRDFVFGSKSAEVDNFGTCK